MKIRWLAGCLLSMAVALLFPALGSAQSFRLRLGDAGMFMPPDDPKDRPVQKASYTQETKEATTDAQAGSASAPGGIAPEEANPLAPPEDDNVFHQGSLRFRLGGDGA